MKVRKAAKMLSTATLAVVIGLGAAGTAHAVTWHARTYSGDSLTDAGGARWAEAFLYPDDDNVAYYAKFNPDGEELIAYDRLADGHATRIEMSVYSSYNPDDGFLVDRDTFYVSTADGTKTFNLGSPDGSGDIPEDYSINMRVCINETVHCTDWVRGRS
ncbi:hypothetical protein [Streptomyces sp. T21Q-yed]|nr:hypothetical protein [Streptomyces sp. T21Q-yed]MDF3143449.1 hypothetical protein [Streptomyces sp. T21Q-yed]